MRARIQQVIENALKQAADAGNLPQMGLPEAHQIGIPKQESHGDFSSNAAMILAAQAKCSPREVAGHLAKILAQEPLFEKVEVAGPGFLNFFIARGWWGENLRAMQAAGDRYGESAAGGGRKVLVEFVSANPTGPLHVGHGRGAAVGDSLVRVLRAGGFNVEAEYYINDVGNQMRTLGSSVYLRYLEHFGRQVEFPKEYYQGDYIRDIAAEVAEADGDRYLDVPLETCLPRFTEAAVKNISAGIEQDLQDFGVHFDRWFSERTLHESGFVAETLDLLQKQGQMYEQDGALWFRASSFGDEKDRVVRRSNGDLTYFAADIAYHRHKLERGYDLLVDIWGADHHGYVPRLKAAVQAMGHPEQRVRVLLVQLVNLLEGGQLKAMSTRAGEFVTLRDVLDDVGRDAARFIFLTRRCDSHLDFDLAVARTQSQENPVYYVQYAHARLCSIFRNAQDQGIELRDPKDIDVSALTTPEDVLVLRQLDAFPGLVADAALALEPHRISYYLRELASLFHGYYAKNRFIDENGEVTQARLLLAGTMRQVFRKGLELLGVTAPETM